MKFYIPLRLYLIADILIDDPAYGWERLVSQIVELFIKDESARNEFISYVCELDGLDEELIEMEREVVLEEYSDFLKSRKVELQNETIKNYISSHVKEDLIKLWYLSITMIHPHFLPLAFSIGLMSGCQFIALQDFIKIVEGKNRSSVPNNYEMSYYKTSFQSLLYSLPTYLSKVDLHPEDTPKFNLN